VVPHPSTGDDCFEQHQRDDSNGVCHKLNLLCDRDDVKRVARVLERHLNTPNHDTRLEFKRALQDFIDDFAKTGTSTAAGNRD